MASDSYQGTRFWATMKRRKHSTLQHCLSSLALILAAFFPSCEGFCLSKETMSSQYLHPTILPQLSTTFFPSSRGFWSIEEIDIFSTSTIITFFLNYRRSFFPRNEVFGPSKTMASSQYLPSSNFPSIINHLFPSCQGFSVCQRERRIPEVYNRYTASPIPTTLFALRTRVFGQSKGVAFTSSSLQLFHQFAQTHSPASKPSPNYAWHGWNRPAGWA